jgi:hypothetical protein
LSGLRYKPAAFSYEYRDIKKIDTVDFERRLRSSLLFMDPADTLDDYLNQLELTVTRILDDVAYIRRGSRAGGRKAARWLDPHAVAVKHTDDDSSVNGRSSAAN